MSYVKPTTENLKDPYVLQLIEYLDKAQETIEELEAENKRLEATVKEAFMSGYYFGETNQICEGGAWEAYKKETDDE